MPLAADGAQTGPSHVVGVLFPSRTPREFSAFVAGLRELGYEEGRNLRLIIRSADGNLQRLSGLAAELVDSKADVIVAYTTPASRAVIDVTKEIPIVMGIVGDPVATGFVTNLARPGGNITGVSNLSGELTGKRLALLKEAVPSARRIAVMLHPGDPITRPQVEDAERASLLLGVELRFFPVRAAPDLSSTFERAVAWRADAIMWLAGQAAQFQNGTIQLARQARRPPHRTAHQVRARHQRQDGTSSRAIVAALLALAG